MRVLAALLLCAATAAQAQDPHAGHTVAPTPVPSEMDMEVSAPEPAAPPPASAVGNAPAPAPPTDHWADRDFPPAEMAAARANMMREHSGSFAQIIFNLAEAQFGDGQTGYRWDAQAWFGGDINRLVIKSEGEGAATLDSGEVQALYSRAIDPYWNLQAGVRHDFEPGPPLTYAAFGIEGLAPYWFDVEASGFVSTGGDVLGRLMLSYDQRITQKLILQPRAEFNLSAQDMPAQRVGAGLVNAELGLRLRYEISRKFAPYIGLSFDGKTGTTASYARADGEAPTATRFVVGVRSWF
ncbi:copper resistance protein B [Polymorphobacter arshaanensis]|uniref:Copper resistance protein B n=1 Tax=Glacieibacterium arshaanense TaxID=2511025 RepID=A0A4Y9EKP1_9SPHN|nr:copper resistance protein B [Polymorphobacter arshaanensis]TFU01372.1 copper resistance protein B [Polymorphobacter arshaanensis]